MGKLLINILAILAASYFMFFANITFAADVPRASWSVLFVDSEEDSIAQPRVAENVYDGDPNTVWQTVWIVNGGTPPPHEVQIDLGSSYDLNAFRYLPRQSGVNGNIRDYEFYVSTDGVNWSSPVASGAFSNPGSAAEKRITFPTTTGRYIRLRATSEINGNIWTTVAELNVEHTVSGSPDVPRASWSVLFVDSEEDSIAQPRVAENVYDGDPNTVWQTVWIVNGGTPPPHEVQIDLGSSYDLNAFRYLPRQDGGVNGNIRDYEFYVSSDGVNWGSSVASGAFSNPGSAAEKRITFPTTTGRYIRLVATSEINGNIWTTVAELNVEGVSSSGNLQPIAMIDMPISDVTIFVGGSVNFEGSGTDLDGSISGYSWNFVGGTPSSSTVEDPGNVTFSSVGTFNITLTVTDNEGLPSAPVQRMITVQDAGDPTIPRTNWTLQFVDSEAIISSDRVGENTFDGDPNTLWQTEWISNNGPPPPHEIQIDLGSAYEIDAFRYLPRQSGVNGNIRDYEFYVSSDGVNWGSPVASGAFLNPGSAAEKRITFATVTGQFIRLVATSEINSNIWTTVAELNVEGRCQNPYVKILRPPTLGVQAPPDFNVETSVCLNSLTHSGWGVRFTLDGGSTQTDFIAPYEAFFQNVTLGNHIIEAQIVDDTSAAVAGSNTLDTVTQVGSGDHYVGIGDSIMFGLGDDIVADDISLDGRNNSRGATPLINNNLTQSLGYPHTVINEGVSGLTSADAIDLLPLVLSRNPDARFYLITLGTNDTGGMTPLMSGLGTTANPDNPVTYKDYMQKIINLVRNSGSNREPYLSKVPYAITNATRQALIQEFNQVIDELVSENFIMVTPPDFYTYYEANQSQLFDNFHPNGVGHQNMALCWSQAIQGLMSICNP